MEYMKNTSYFFVPFKYEKYERFKDLTRMLDESDSWNLTHDEIMYMLRISWTAANRSSVCAFIMNGMAEKEKIFQD